MVERKPGCLVTGRNPATSHMSYSQSKLLKGGYIEDYIRVGKRDARSLDYGSHGGFQQLQPLLWSPVIRLIFCWGLYFLSPVPIAEA